MREVEAAARTLGFEVASVGIRRSEDIAPAFGDIKGRADALYVSGDALLNALLANQQFDINALAASAKLPTMFNQRDGRSRWPDVLRTELPGPVPARGRIR
jgi:putative tryptophan/tyrosine transport system substrate-binding protein